MGRLIDADVLIGHFEKLKKESASLVDMAHIIGFQSVIDAQPTAYDPEEVVEQLEEIRPEEDCFDNAEEYKHALSRHNKIIEIVKGGGVE